MVNTRLQTRLEGFKYYHYNPSQVAAAIAFILFLLATVYHSWKMIKTRTWFWLPFVIGGICTYNAGKTRRGLANNLSQSS